MWLDLNVKGSNEDMGLEAWYSVDSEGLLLARHRDWDPHGGFGGAGKVSSLGKREDRILQNDNW